MNKNIIFVAVAILLIGVAVVMFLSENDNEYTTEADQETITNDDIDATDQIEPEDQTDEAVVADHTVTFTDEGYQPASITIAAGESIAFVNQSSQDNWTASDPHPSHTDLPSFDAGRGYAPGEQYVYTFDEVGEWGYHDHLRSSITGTVIVE